MASLPGPKGRSSVWRGTPAPEDDGTAAKAGIPAPSPPSDAHEENSPTIISSNRARTTPDLRHADSLIGRKLGHYELIESVGVGGMAAVIKAMDLDLGRVVALKILPPDMAADPENITRFKQEARAAARLDHENVARVYYCGEDQGLHFIAFEFVEGENLRVRMAENGGSLPVSQSIHYLIQVTAGLAHAASRGVVHRDIKPSNIVITPDGKAKIVDMGLARNLDARATNGQLTQSGMTLGTFDYISPEQALDPRSADSRSDIYSLGCTFYHVLTGRPPVPEGTAAKKLHCHEHVAPLDPRELNPAIPDELAAILGKMIAKDPKQRYQHPDHLLQHLLIVSKKLNLSDIPLSESQQIVSPFVDQPLPEPPELSPWWIGAAVVCLAVGLFAITGGFGNGSPPLDSAPFWQVSANDPLVDASRPKEMENRGATVERAGLLKGPQEAKNAIELAALLRQGTPHIKLRAGVIYDLSRLGRKETEGEEIRFEGANLVLECDRLIDKPTIRLLTAPCDEAMSARPGTVTFRGPSDGGNSQVRLRGIRFEIVDDDATSETASLRFQNIDRLDVEECSFVPPLRKGKPEDGAAAVAIQHVPGGQTIPEAHFDRCWFAPGSIGIHLRNGGAQRLRATECAFGPLYAAVRVDGSLAENSGRRTNEVHFESCSLLMTAGAVVEIGDLVPCRITSGMCLYSNPELPERATSQAFVIHQLGAMAPETRYEGMKPVDLPAGARANGYHQVLAYSNGDLSCTFDDCRQEMIPVEDAAARILTRNPWVEQEPIRRLFEFPKQIKQVIALDLKQEILRLEPDKNRNLLGAKNVTGTRVYDFFPLESPIPDAGTVANVKIWYPEFAGRDEKLPFNTYRSLEKALVDLAKGDVLLIRHTGLLEIDPIEFKKADTDITIRPDENYRPVLMPRAPTLKKDPALFKLFGGQLTLENLRFRLTADRAPAIVTLPGGGNCTFRNCVATLEGSDDLSLISLADPRGEMMMMGADTPEKWPTPRIIVENTFVRGRGKALSVHRSRSFDLRMKGCLVVLDGSLIAVEPSAMDLADAGTALATLDQITTYLTKPLLVEKAAEKRAETKGAGLLPLSVQATSCVFVPATELAAMVMLERVETAEQGDGLFQWRECRGNFYAFRSDQAMLQIHLENADAAAPERMVRERWLNKFRETDYTFGDVNFAVVPATKRFDGVKSGDFEIKSTEPPFKGDLSAIGSPIATLRRLAIDE